MVKTLRAATVFLMISPLLVHCVPTQDVNSLDLRIRNLDNRVFQLGKAVNQMGGSGTGSDNPLDQVMTKQAEMADHLDRLNSDVMAIKAKQEESSHLSQGSQSDNEQLKPLQRKVEELSQQFALLSDQVNQNTLALSSGRAVKLTSTTHPPREDEPRADEIAPAPKEETSNSSKMKELTPVKEKAKPEEKAEEKPAKGDSEAAAAGDPGKATYDKGLELFRASKFNEAYRTFNDYINKYPKGKMAPNARFWLGDCYYNQQEYELSILEYQKVVEKFPSDAKAPAALLKQGLAFEKLKDNDTAKIVYNKLMKDYPKSDQVETAKKRLETFK